MFDRLFNRSKSIAPTAQVKPQSESGKGKPIYLVADRLVAPITLQGQRSSLILKSGEEVTIFVTYILLAKSAGWTGGSELAHVLEDSIVNKIIKNGTVVSKSEASQFVDIVISQTNGSARTEPVIGSVLKLLELGDITIYAQ